MSDGPENENHFSPIPVKEEGHGTIEMEMEGDTYWSDEEETLKSEGKVHWQNHFSPPGIICSTDRIYLTANETLVLPEDNNGSTKEEEEKVYYTKADSMKLERFLQKEQNHL